MRGKFSYEIVFWCVFIVTSVPIIADRFVTNLWPRQSFHTSDYKTGSDHYHFKQGPIGVRLYDVIARFSGRYFMLAMNALFFTMMHTLHRRMEDSFIGRKIIDFSDETARRRIHKWLGITVCITTLVHVWSILFPVMFHGYGLQVVAGYFTWPLSEQKPKGFKDVSIADEMVMMQVDDLYRLILMTFLMGPIVFVSYQWICSNYRFGIRLHQFVLLMYFIDLTRRHTHPHSWIINMPVLLIWIIDLIWGHYYRHSRAIVNSIPVTSDYLLLLWNCERTQKFQEDKEKIGEDSIAEVFYMRKFGKQSCQCSGCNWERKHPFTSFKRRDCLIPNMDKLSDPNWFKLSVNSGVLCHNQPLNSTVEVDDKLMKVEIEWNRGVILRSYSGKLSHTNTLRQLEQGEALMMDTWGSFHSGSYKDYIDSASDVVLVGGGSGSGYLIDTLLYMCSRNGRRNVNPTTSAHFSKTNKVDCENATEIVYLNSEEDTQKYLTLIFTTKDLNLVQWWTNVINSILSENELSPSVRLSITIALTKGAGANHGVQSIQDGDCIKFPWGKVVLGRCDMVGEMQQTVSVAGCKRKRHVFCQGGVPLQEGVRQAALQTGFKYHECHSFDNGSSGFKIQLKCCC